MSRNSFQHVDAWVFDLDNTLYPPATPLFDQIERRMTDYVMARLNVSRTEADALRRTYWSEHGTTLAGLMRVHDLDPGPYLADVHDIDLSHLVPCTSLRAAISALPGRRIVYTNGSREHARRVIDALGLDGVFETFFGIEDANYLPKPEAVAFDLIFGKAGLDPRRAAMFEDDPRNLAIPHALGMRTVLVGPGAPAAHVHHQTDDLAAFLAGLV